MFAVNLTWKSCVDADQRLDYDCIFFK